jgi:two-component system, OmpR family, KDP operon response regulator KdpE
MTRILVIDDDRQLLRALRIALTARGYDVTVALDGAAGLTAAQGTPPDLVIIDLGLPDMDGVDIVHALRGWSTTPILVLSARLTEQSKINALDAGADDYVTKPFAVGELLARIRAALRRSTPVDQPPIVTTAAFTVDLNAKRATTAVGGEARLTPTEWHLLEVLARPHGQPAPQTRTRPQPRYLRTDPGLGYRFTPDDWA